MLGLDGSIPAASKPARILIIDDTASSRTKLSKAVGYLGHIPETVEDGAKGLERMQAGDIDLLLLDILMPGMDGFEVLKRLKADPNLREVPTLVISGVDEIAEAARAIELGAVDFLPKTFNSVLLKARVNACLERRSQRARELEMLAQIERLTAAADALDSDEMNPMELEIRDIAVRPGALGNLSRVLLNKSTMVYNRRKAQAQQIKNLIGALMLLFLGATFGLKPALARLYLAEAGNPLSVGLYTMGLTSVLIGCYAIASKVEWPRMSLRTFGFCLILAILTLAPQVLLFWVAEEVPGVIIAIIVSLESFIVFFLASVIGLERLSLRRLGGLLLGISGVLILLLPQFNVGPGTVAISGLLLAMCIPACFAGENILLALTKSFDLDVIAATAIIFAISTVILLVTVAMSVGFVPLHFPMGGFELTVIAFSCADTVATIIFVSLIRYAGPVFTSQKAYTVAIGGVAWSVLLLREEVSVSSAAALALIVAGLYFVARKALAEKLLQRTPLAEAN